MPTVIIEQNGLDIDCDSYGGDVDVFIVSWQDVVDSRLDALEAYGCAHYLDEPFRTSIRDRIVAIWPDIETEEP